MTEFCTLWGLFEYVVIHSGLANSPVCFQRFITSILSEFLGVFFVYIDDILIFSKNGASHTRHLEVLSSLLAHGLTAWAEKCSFYQTKVSFLGFVVSSSGLQMDPSKLDTITAWPYPQNLNQLNRFLGFPNFHCRFIFNFSSIAAPLNAQTHNKSDVISGFSNPASVAAFHSLICASLSAPVLSQFDFDKPHVLQVNCPGFTLLAMLSQSNDEGLLHPVYFLSRKLTLAKRARPIYDQELGVILAAFKEWREWLVGTPTPVSFFSDHTNLRYFMTSQCLTPGQAQWASYLGLFIFRYFTLPAELILLTVLLGDLTF